MKIKIIKAFAFSILFIILGCFSEDPSADTGPNYIPNPIIPNQPKQLNYLALGDSYTIGQSVCETCRFPEQLKKSLGKDRSMGVLRATPMISP